MIDNRQVHIHTHNHEPILPMEQPKKGFGFGDFLFAIILFPASIWLCGPYFGPVAWAMACCIPSGLAGRILLGLFAALWAYAILAGMAFAQQTRTECHKIGDKWVCKETGEIRQEAPKQTECYRLGDKWVCRRN